MSYSIRPLRSVVPSSLLFVADVNQIHASTLNHDPNSIIRLATDLRFVDGSRPFDARWDKFYDLDDGV
jgi:hypothetical protein